MNVNVLIYNNGTSNLVKFDLRSNEVVILGYLFYSKEYKVYNKRIIYVEESVFVINVLDLNV